LSSSRSFDEPEVLQENSIQEDTSLPNINTESFIVTYSIIVSCVGTEGSDKSKLAMVLPRDALVLSPSGWQFWQINAYVF
jgi:hypothetical protein